MLDLDQELKVNGPETKDRGCDMGTGFKRFAFNYSPPHAHHTTYETVAFYQLRNDKSVAFDSPVDQASERGQLAQLASESFAEKVAATACSDSSPERDILRVRRWANASSAFFYAYSAGDEGEAAALLTLKFDAAGKWKLVNTHRMSKKELEEEQ